MPEEHGRFVYVEPNDMENRGISNIMQFSPEDYCISVGLEIEVMDRYAYGSSNGAYKMQFSSDNGSVSFFGGKGGDNEKQGFLSTDFTNVSANDARKEGIRECLGVDSIQITYNSWMYPEVTVVFTDVRGSALFMPQDKGLKIKTNTETGEKEAVMDGGSFFKSLFTFPYPLFKLSVKGFYGMEVTYKLTVSKFTSEFDCERGFFTATVNFIGYMYGVYTDTPMSFLSIAPYIDNKAYWNEQVSAGKFMFESCVDSDTVSKHPMMTIPEFRALVSQASAKAQKASMQSSVGILYTTANEKKSKLESFKARFPITEGLGGTWGKKGNLYISKYYGGEAILNSTLGNAFSNFITDVSAFETAYTMNISSSLNNISKQLVYDEKTKNYCMFPLYKFVKTDDNIEVYELKYNTTKKEFQTNYSLGGDAAKNKIEECEIKIEDFTNERDTIFAYYFISNFDDVVTKQIEVLSKESKTFEDNLHSEQMNLIRNLLQFDLSIENVFRLIFAHYETFIHHYYLCLDNIREEGSSRNKENFEGYDKTDVPKERLEKAPFPPFTAFYKKDENGVGERQLTFPVYKLGEGGRTTEEKFIESLLAASEMYLKADTENQKETDKVFEMLKTGDEGQPDISTFVPLTLNDYIQRDKGYNPYSEVFSINDNDRCAELLISIFYLRAYYFLYMFDGKNTGSGGYFLDNGVLNKFVKLEADNFYLANPQFSKTFKKAIKGLKRDDGYDCVTKKNGSKIWEISTDCNPLIEEKDNESSWEHVISRWINLGDGKTAFPVGNFNINTIMSDKEMGEISGSDNYIIFKGDKIVNENGFFVNTNASFFDNIISGVNEGSFKKMFNATIAPNFISDEIFKKAYCLLYGENNRLVNNIFYGLNDKQVWEAKDITDISNRNMIGCGTLNSGKQLVSFNSIYNGKYDESYSVFSSPAYKKQGNILAKAYLFLFATPISDDYMREVVSHNNCVVLNSALLREGAYYYFSGSSIAEVIVLEDGTKEWKYEEGEIPIIEKNKTLCFLKEDSKTNYLKWDYAETSNGRKTALIKYFKEWANSKFNAIDMYWRDKNIGGFDKALFEFYTEKVTILDYCNSIRRDITNDYYLGKIGGLCADFIKKIKYKCDAIKDENINNTPVALDMPSSSKDLKLSLYMNLKNLYDKWFCSRDRETWYLNNEDGDFQNFEYIDSFYNKIGKRFMVNGSHVNEILASIVPSIQSISANTLTTYNQMSFYEFMNEVCQKNNMVFMALPQKFGNGDTITTSQMKNAFTPWPYSALQKGPNSKKVKNSYVCIYAYRPSDTLNIADEDGDYAYADDSFLITNDSSLPVSISNMDGERIPAFGVSFARQDQSMFKRVSLNMEDRQETDVSIATTIGISQQGTMEPRETTMYGQDIYRVYAGYSYSCQVEMMGNAQIMPLMYFQLNNIPMWKGAYMITKVEHSVRANSMVTTFTGVRQSKFATPLANGELYFTDSEGNVYTTSNRLSEGIPFSPKTLTVNVRVVREIFLEDRTIGKMYIDGKYVCDTLENKDRGLTSSMEKFEVKSKKVDKETAIPYGKYNLTSSIFSQKFGKREFYIFTGGYLPRVMNVTGFDGILIHVGTKPEDTDGCILVGQYNSDSNTLQNSRKTFIDIYDILGKCKDDSTITIEKKI